MDNLVAALDGGGTKTQGAWADVAGHVWLADPVGGCNPQDGPHWADNLRSALQALPGEVARATLGLPGYGELPRDDAAVQRLVADCLPGRAELLNDVALAYSGAFPDGGGTLILAGTGSMAMAAGPNGLRRTGGWGDAYGDEGSAYSIGRAALSRASKEADGRMVPSGFADALAARLGLAAKADGFSLVGWIAAQRHQRAAVASVARHVDQLADAGDPVALALLQSAAQELLQHLVAATRLAGLVDTAPWACAGSVFNSRTVLRAMAASLGQPPVEPPLDALGGGLWLAAKTAGWPVDHDWAQRIAKGLAAAFSERATE